MPTPSSLLFADPTPAMLALSQGSYKLGHPVLGMLDWFMVPVASGNPKPNYEVLNS